VIGLTSIPRTLTAFAAWLPLHPAGHRGPSDVSVRHQVARYCNFLGTDGPLGADPLVDVDARDRAVHAYRAYLDLFNTAAMPVSAILQCLDRFYDFLGLGPVRAASDRRSAVAEASS
jgi:hypothetical protein